MKKPLLILSLTTLFSAAFGQTQIGNSNFEQWETSTSELAEPINWNSFKSASGTWSSSGGQQMDKKFSARPGSSGTTSVRIWSRSVLGVKANGNVTLGRINMGSTTPNNSANYNYSTTTGTTFSEALTTSPDSIVAWVKYKPGNTTSGYTARISSVIHNNTDGYKDPNDVAGANTVATAALNFPYTNGGWQRISIPFTYVGTPSNAAFILVTCTTNNVPGGGTASDTLYVDDMELIYVPKAAFTAANTVCLGSAINFTNTSTNFPTSYSWNFGDGSPLDNTTSPSHTYATAGTYQVTLTATNQWGSTTTTAYSVTVNTIDNATFSYGASSYCLGTSNQTPTTASAGTFSASPSGLNFVSNSTGEIDLGTSTSGTYTLTYTTSGACPATSTGTITLNATPDPSFNYASSTFCLTGSNETPTVSNSGTFSATPAGLTFVSTTTGEINVGGSTAGTYTVTHTTTGTCSSSSNSTITITASPDANFTYSTASYCQSATDPSPVFGSGASAGLFTVSPSGLSLDANTGSVDLSASNAGTYAVTNTIAASGSCPMATGTFNITVVANPTVTLGNFTQVCTYTPAFALTGGSPAGGTYSGTGISGGTFDPSTASANSTVTITYSYTDGTTTCSNTATNTIYVSDCLGLEEVATAFVNVYPNPTTGLVHVTNLDGKQVVEVINALGTVVQKRTLSASDNTLDLSNLNSGVYFVRVENQLFRIIKK